VLGKQTYLLWVGRTLPPPASRLNRFDLNGRVTVITGDNAGMTFGIAKGLAAAGSAIVVAGRRPAKNLEVARALEVFNVKMAAFEVGVCKEESCRSMVESTVERFGRINTLVNSAGITIRKQPETYSLAEWNMGSWDQANEIVITCSSEILAKRLGFESNDQPSSPTGVIPAVPWRILNHGGGTWAMQEHSSPDQLAA
jgi:short chain dehydrogenase